MKRFIAATIFLGGILYGISEATATIYQYVDDQGKVHYTNELSSVPADKLDQVTEMEETSSDDVPPAPKYSGPIYPLNQQPLAAEVQAKQRERQQRKQQLEAEYQRLLKEKEAIDDNQSFQTRRHKYKYKHRPYIIALEKRDAELTKQLADLKRQLDAM